MSISCWRAISYPKLVTSLTMLKEFDGHTLKHHGILTKFPIGLGSKNVLVDVEVVNSPLGYNLLLGCSWFYVIKFIVSSIFQILCFPH